MTNQQKWKELSRRLDEIEAYARCVGKVGFDMECCAPEEGIEQRYGRLLEELHADGEGLTAVQRKAVEHLYDRYAKVKNIPAKLDYEMDLASNKAYGAWLKAKKANDFSLFRDSLGELIRYLSLLLNREMPQEERVEALKNEYHIQVDDALREDVSKMCNYSDAILRMGENKGLEQGRIMEAVSIYRDEMEMDDNSIIKKIMKRFTLQEQDARKYVIPQSNA